MSRESPYWDVPLLSASHDAVVVNDIARFDACPETINSACETKSEQPPPPPRTLRNSELRFQRQLQHPFFIHVGDAALELLNGTKPDGATLQRPRPLNLNPARQLHLTSLLSRSTSTGRRRHARVSRGSFVVPGRLRKVTLTSRIIFLRPSLIGITGTRPAKPDAR